MTSLADQITTELQVLIGEPISGCWRAANMQMFGFGQVEGNDPVLHLQCRWRIVDAVQILFGSDDRLQPADENISLDDFDYDKDDSVLDVVQKSWFK